jgi:predicted aspartyl protease
MPLTNYPFTLSNGIYRPTLQIRIVNPHTGLSQRTYGLIDTGADECAVPASYAPLLGHDLKKGGMKRVNTGNGIAIAYVHTTRFDILDPLTGAVAYTINDTPIDFLANLHLVLLGVKSFLSNFVLHIDYPRKVFSLKKPK